ncbi:MAG: helix-hairpin-helix domain-containing protein [Sphingopyxis sp.]|uniref:helix-hairpin-helix domain-containing protein n=1 Tax=Sphingopyxis sp. TaxID=1908224 RepID=UPI002AB9DEB2|nr:helix-hairpin-helix domain-containing protein [Sphingopyxis sp.]MDZ3831150.1 helix-hairpin-helix domain-containing protein [Sphingopyxis sp.]
MTVAAAFPAAERERLLAVKGVGPTVVARLEEIGIASLAELAEREPEQICVEVSLYLGASCWRNSPQSRAAIAAAVACARGAAG